MIDRACFDERDEVPPYEHQAWHDSPTHEAKLGESMGWAMSTDSLPFLDDDRELAARLRQERPDLGALTDSALHARARAMLPYLQQTFENAMVVSSLSALGTGALGAICEALGDSTMAIRLLAGIEVDSAAPSHVMWEIGRFARASAEVGAAFDTGIDGVLDRLESGGEDAAAFLARFRQFLVDHGSRGQNEYDPRAASWEVRPRLALAAIDLMRRADVSHTPSVRQAASTDERDRLRAEIRSRLSGDAETGAAFESALRSASLFLAGRERAKTNSVRVINEIRMCFHEYGRRLVDRGVIAEPEQVFMVTDQELDALRGDPQRFADVVAERWAQYRSLFDHEPVFVVDGRVPSLDEMTPRSRTRVEQAPGDPGRCDGDGGRLGRDGADQPRVTGRTTRRDDGPTHPRHAPAQRRAGATTSSPNSLSRSRPSGPTNANAGTMILPTPSSRMRSTRSSRSPWLAPKLALISMSAGSRP